MKKLIIPIATIAALTAMAIAASALMTPSVSPIKPTIASEVTTPKIQANPKDVEAEDEDDCCAKAGKVEIAAEKEDCADCEKAAAKKDCDDCEEMEDHKDAKVETSTF
ncbi:MAG: hypothetical protein ACKVQS_02045 [Fimbriimonadaceae bacterium]